MVEERWQQATSIKQLNKICDMEPFEMQHNLVKSDRQKREFQGPEIKKLLNKLDELRTFLPTQLHTFSIQNITCYIS